MGRVERGLFLENILLRVKPMGREKVFLQSTEIECSRSSPTHPTNAYTDPNRLI
jgi:hypothetical protein